ncbi:MAG: hypothetical protein AAGB25_05495 [Pseudomonadota bacterium]
MNSADVVQTASSLVSQYGEDAAVIAVLRAAEYAANGDVEACDHWEAVAAYLERSSGA